MVRYPRKRVNSNSRIGAEQQDGARRYGVPRGRDDDRLWELENPNEELGAGRHQAIHVLGAGAHHSQVEAARQHPGPPRDQHGGGLLLGAIEMRFERADDVAGEGIRLAIVEAGDGNRFQDLAADDVFGHGGPLCFGEPEG